MKIVVKANVKATLPSSSCFHIATELSLAAREAEMARRQAKRGKIVRRFSEVMDDIKRSLVLAADAKPGVSKEAMKIAQKAADSEFAYLASSAPHEKRLKRFAMEIEGIQEEIGSLAVKVSKRCGYDEHKKGEFEKSYQHGAQLRNEVRRLDLKAEKKRVKR